MAWLLGQHPRVELCGGHTCDVHALFSSHIEPVLKERLYLQGRAQRCACVCHLMACAHTWPISCPMAELRSPDSSLELAGTAR